MNCETLIHTQRIKGKEEERKHVCVKIKYVSAGRKKTEKKENSDSEQQQQKNI